MPVSSDHTAYICRECRNLMDKPIGTYPTTRSKICGCFLCGRSGPPKYFREEKTYKLVAMIGEYELRKLITGVKE